MHWQITIATVGRVRMFGDTVSVRAAVRAIVRIAGEWLLLFAVVDDHVHVVLRCDRGRAAILACSIARAMAHLGAPKLQPGWISAVNGRSHLETLVGYEVGQAAHHGLPWPITYSGSCLLDLTRARCLAGFDPGAICKELPRVNVLALALSEVGVSDRVVAASDEDVHSLGTSSVWQMALSATGLSAATTRELEVVVLRAAWGQLAKRADLVGAREIAGISERTWRRERDGPEIEAVVVAIRRRVSLEAIAKRMAGRG